jgi:hypothetical protein
MAKAEHRCAWCGELIATGVGLDPRTVASEHLKTCKAHPMRELERTIDELRARKCPRCNLKKEVNGSVHELIAKLQTWKESLARVKSALVCLKETPMAGLPQREAVVDEALEVVKTMEVL